ncbi:PREDICTED: IgGFc-binding protein-like [Branchiostoma belcheri]|uniref:IgGFc-binding protein-like n=1 Tax=Branchiostoma belcheri TaxID=7741 RepID=A0A6P5A8K8_BRABE|nr:PREDICTED: IgGFc-binding protein-like [Branchiostoma belcheri]
MAASIKLGRQRPLAGQCSAWGDPHYITFDGRRHDFQGTCKYVLVRHADFTVAARNVHRRGMSQRVAFCDHVEVNVHNYEIHLRSGAGKEVNGYRRSLPVCLDRKVAISVSGRYVKIQTDQCLSVLYDGRHSVIIRLPTTYKGKISGMCGNYNGQSNDDNLMPTGQVASTSLLYGNSWIAPDDDTCPDTRPQDNFDSNDITASDRQLYGRPDKCGLLQLRTGPFGACISVLNPATYFGSCLFDMAADRGDEDMLCENLEAYSDDCTAKGGKPGRWRTANRCPMPCPAHSHYDPCGSACPLTCTEPNPRACVRICVESCVCDQGYILSGSVCVPRSSCGCSSNGNYYQKNEVWRSGNQICKCTNGRITCEAEPSGTIPTEIGGTSWDTCPGSLSFVTIGWSGVWGVNSRGVVFYRVGTAGKEGHFGKEWKQIDGNLAQISSGKGIVWGGITDKVWYGKVWRLVTGQPLRSVCVSSSSNFVWGVSTTGTVWRRTGITTSNLIGTGWQQVPGGSAIRGGLSHVSIGYCGVWGVTSSGVIWHRSGTYGGKGSAGTGWVQVTGYQLVSISVGYNVVWGVSTIGQVFIRIGIMAQTPQGTAWRLVGGSLTQIYVSSSSNRVWGCGLSHHIYLRVGISWSSGREDVPVDGSKSVQQRNFPSVRQFILKLAAGFEIGPSKARIGVYQFAKDIQTEFKMNQYNSRAVLDGSKSVQQRNFPSVRQFILKLAAGFEIGPSKARIGVYQFAKDIQTEFKMNQYNSRAVR